MAKSIKMTDDQFVNMITENVTKILMKEGLKSFIGNNKEGGLKGLINKAKENFNLNHGDNSEKSGLENIRAGFNKEKYNERTGEMEKTYSVTDHLKDTFNNFKRNSNYDKFRGVRDKNGNTPMSDAEKRYNNILNKASGSEREGVYNGTHRVDTQNNKIVRM